MNITPTQKKWLAWILVALVIFAVNTYLGVTYPTPDPPTDPIFAETIQTSTHTLTATGPLTITGVLTNVVLFYEQQ